MKIYGRFKRLNNNFYEMEDREIENELNKTIREFNEMLASKKNLLREAVREILVDIEELKDNITKKKKEEIKTEIENLYGEIAELIDQQMTSEIGGTGEYLRNMREASKKRKEERLKGKKGSL